MLFKHIINTIFEDLSGIRARENVLHITHYNRIQASPGFREAAEYVHSVLEEYGFDNAKILEFPADGKINQWDWESPIAWKGIDAELWLIEPHKELLCDYHEVPTCLITHSQSAVTVADLVDVGPGTEEWNYDKSFVQDAIVLTTGPARDVYPFLIKNGVQGMIRYPSDIRSFQYPDMVIADAFWPVNEDREIIPFGFSISRRQAERLKGYLAEGKKVRVMAKVNADLGDGDLNIVEASLPSEEEDAEEILMVAHLCNPKPSANDNASGSGLLLEIARVLRKLILEGKLAPNKRTIRFLWLTEYSGAIAWLHWNFHKIDNIFACINLNAVGESPERIGTPLRISIPPYSTESFLEDLMSAIAELVAEDPRYCSMDGSRRKLKYELEAFSGTSDHTIFIDKYFDIPSIMLGHEDPFSGTNMDIIENVDSSELLRVGLIATTAAYSLVAPDNSLARQMLLFQKAGSHNRVNHFFKRALLNIYESLAANLDIHFYDEVGKASFLIKREEENLDSLSRYYDNDYFHDSVEEVITNFKAFSIKELKAMEKALRVRGAEVEYQITRLKTLPQEYREAQALVPIQKLNAPFRGIFKKVIFQRLHKSTKDWLKNSSLAKKGNVYGEIHNLINGTNSIFDIYIAVDLQFGNIKISDVRTYIVLLQKVQLVDIKMMKKKKAKEEEHKAVAEEIAAPEPEAQKEEAPPEAEEEEPEEVYDEAEAAEVPLGVSAEITPAPEQLSLKKPGREVDDSVPSEYLEAMIAEQADHQLAQPETLRASAEAESVEVVKQLEIAETPEALAEEMAEQREPVKQLEIAETPEALAEEMAEQQEAAEMPEAMAEEVPAKMIEIPEAIAEEIPEEMAEMPEAVADEVPARMIEIPEAVAEEIPEEMAEMPEAVADEVPARMIEIPEAVAEEIPEEMAEMPEAVAEKVPVKMIEIPEAITEEIPEEMAERQEAVEMPEAVAEEVTEEMAELQEAVDIPEAVAEKVTEEVAELQEAAEMPEAVAEEVTEEMAEQQETAEMPEEVAEEVTEEVAERQETAEMPEAVAEEVTQEVAEPQEAVEMPEAVAEEVTEEMAELQEAVEMPEAVAEEVTEEVAELQEAAEMPEAVAEEVTEEVAEQQETAEMPEGLTEVPEEMAEMHEAAEIHDTVPEEAPEVARRVEMEERPDNMSEEELVEYAKRLEMAEMLDAVPEEEPAEMAEQQEKTEPYGASFEETSTALPGYNVTIPAEVPLEEPLGTMAAQPFETLTAESPENISAEFEDEFSGEYEKTIIISGSADQIETYDLDLDSLELDLKKIVVGEARDNGKTGKKNLTELEDMSLEIDDFIALDDAALRALNASASAGGEDPGLDSYTIDKQRQKKGIDSENAESNEA